jgi:hypothetical protein
VTYYVQITYDGKHYPKYDDKIINKLNYSDASGLGLGERDHCWYFYTEANAKAFLKKAKSKLRGMALKIVLRECEEDYK